MKSEYVKKTDEIQKLVTAEVLSDYLRKGRLFNKRAGDVVSVIEFRIGRKYNDEDYMLSVIMGIYIPQPATWSFNGIIENDKFYHEYECLIRTSIDHLQNIYSFKGYNDKFFDLNRESIKDITAEICNVLTAKYFPGVEKLNTIEKMLKNSKKIVGELCEKSWWSINFELGYIFLYAAVGNMPKFTSEFQEYYNHTKMKKGNVKYLEELAKELNILLQY